MIRPISKDTHRHQTEAATTEHTLRLLGLHSNFRDFSDQVFGDAQSGCVSWEVGGQRFPPHAAPHSSLTGDCPDGFLHLLHVFGDVIDDNVTLQQTCEELFSGDSLKRRATVPLCQLVDKGNWMSRQTDGLQIRSPPPPQDSHIWSICRSMSIKMKSWFSFACNSQVTKASLKTAWNVVWGDGSAGNAPASQARRPEFALHNLHKNEGWLGWFPLQCWGDGSGRTPGGSPLASLAYWVSSRPMRGCLTGGRHPALSSGFHAGAHVYCTSASSRSFCIHPL